MVGAGLTAAPGVRSGRAGPTERGPKGSNGRAQAKPDARLGLVPTGSARVALELRAQAKNLQSEAALETALFPPLACSRCSRLNGRCGASRNASSSANSPL